MQDSNSDVNNKIKKVDDLLLRVRRKSRLRKGINLSGSRNIVINLDESTGDYTEGTQ